MALLSRGAQRPPQTEVWLAQNFMIAFMKVSKNISTLNTTELEMSTRTFGDRALSTVGREGRIQGAQGGAAQDWPVDELKGVTGVWPADSLH